MSVGSRLAEGGRRNGLQPHFRRRNSVGMPALTLLVLSGAAVATGLACVCWGTFVRCPGEVEWWGYVEPGAEPMAVPCSSYECSRNCECSAHVLSCVLCVLSTPLGNARATLCNACVMSWCRVFASTAGRVPEECSPPARALQMALYCLSVAFPATVISAWISWRVFALQDPYYRYLRYPKKDLITWEKILMRGR